MHFIFFCGEYNYDSISRLGSISTKTITIRGNYFYFL